MSESQGAIGLVNSKFEDSRAYSQSAFATANSLLGALAGATYTAEIAPIDTTISVVVYEPGLADFNGATWSFPTTGELPLSEEFSTIPLYDNDSDLEFISDYPELPVASTFVRIPALDIGTAPNFFGDLNLPDINISALIAAAASILSDLQTGLNTVGPILLGFITNPTQAIGDTVVNAMEAVALQKIEDDFADKYTEVDTFYSSRGWNTPQGVIVARTNELTRLRSTMGSYVHRDVLIKNFELSQQNFQAAMQMYIQYTSENNSLLLNTMKLLYDSAKYASDYVLARFNAFIAKYGVESDVYKLQLSAKIQEVSTALSTNQSLVSQYGSEVAAYSANIGAISAYNENLSRQQDSGIKAYIARTQGIAAYNSAVAQKYSSDVQGYSSNIQGVVANAEMNMKSAQLELQGYEIGSKFEIAKAEVYSRNAQSEIAARQASVQMAIAQLDMTLRNMSTMSNITAEVAKASAQIAAQLAASSMSAVSAGATIGYHTNANYDETKDIIETRINLTGAA